MSSIEERIESLYLQGKTIKQTAEELRIKKGKVIYYLKKKKIARRAAGRPGTLDREKIGELYKEGKGVHTVAKEMGCSHVAVIYHLKKLGIYRGQEKG